MDVLQVNSAKWWNMIGVHPSVTADAIDRPTPENAATYFHHLAEFAYDMDVLQVKAQMPAVTQHAGQLYSEVFDKAMDVLTVFRFAKQLALINIVEDFSLKDVWEPAPKRFRVLLSSMINFCRYKEGRVTLITSLKEQQHLYESQ